MVPSSTSAWKSITRSQNSLPNSRTGMRRIFPVWISVSVSKSSSSVPKPPGKADQGLGPHDQVHLADRKVVELEVQIRRDVGVRQLLVGQDDVQADAERAGIMGAAVGGLHDARPPAGHDHEPVVVGMRSDQASQLARFLVVAAVGQPALGDADVALQHGIGGIALQFGSWPPAAHPWRPGVRGFERFRK